MGDPKKQQQDDTPSPFVFLQPKLELDASPPRQAAQGKPKFEPRVKPRPQARSKTTNVHGEHRLTDPPEDDSSLSGPAALRLASRLDTAIKQSRTETKLPLKEELAVKAKSEPSDTAEPIDVAEHIDLARPSVDAPSAVKQEPNFGYCEASKPEHSPINHELEDRIIRQIDVVLCPNVDENTQLYLLQYPLRPHWRPYGLEERCQEVRVKPRQSKLEVDLLIDTDGESYDHEAAEHLKIKKQTLSSSRTALTTNYAVGILRGNKLYLNPLHAIVQLRPSLKYLDEVDALKKKHANQTLDDKDEEMVDADDGGEEEAVESKQQLVALKVEVKKQETERQEQLRLQSHAYLKQLDEAEAWIPLEPHGIDSPVTDGVRHKMLQASNQDIPFSMSTKEYIDFLVPGRASSYVSEAAAQDATGNEGLSRSFLDTLPLEQRFEKLLSKGRVHVLQFDRLMKLAPVGCTDQEVLSVLQEIAYLVQGCWVAASFLRYTGPICIVRDYILSHFTKSRVIRHHQLEELHVPREMIREVLLPLAVQRPAAGCWEFQESTDRSFMKRHQTIVKEQAQRWMENDDKIKAAALNLRIGTKDMSTLHNAPDDPKVACSIKSILSNQPNLGVGSKASGVLQGEGPGRATGNGGFLGEWSMSEDTRAALPGALREIFLKHNVCSLQFICQSLRELAITKAASQSANPKAVSAAVAAAKGASAPLSELTAAVSQVASNIDGVYFLTSLGNASLDPFRDVVVALLRAKGSNTGLKRIDIMEASKIALKTEVQATVYQKVMKELCYTRGGAWVLKPGDGRPT